jgi:hypothetical protein
MAACKLNLRAACAVPDIGLAAHGMHDPSNGLTCCFTCLLHACYLPLMFCHSLVC